MEFQARNPNVKVSGAAIISFLESMTTRRIGEKYLAQHGIEEVAKDGWYPQQAYFDAMKDFADKIGMPALESVGSHIPDQTGVDTSVELITVLENWDNVYKTNHQGDNQSYFKVTDKGENFVVIETNNTYPCAFDRGLFRALAKKYEPRALLTKEGNQCRANGDDKCVYKIAW